jgi:hypothetical protein
MHPSKTNSLSYISLFNSQYLDLEFAGTPFYIEAFGNLDIISKVRVYLST